MAAELADGETTQVKGSGSSIYTLKNTGGLYSCTCPAWMHQGLPIEKRTCKHLRAFRGDEAETKRLGSAGLLSGKPARPKKPKVEGVCDVCGATEFKRRPDDNAETVRTRMAEYRAKTAPILPGYEARGIVSRIDGMAAIDTVAGQIDAILRS